MKRKLIGVWIFLSLFVAAGISLKAAVQPKDRVLFISSYSYSWETVPEQMEGIEEALGEDVILDYQFMDAKNVDTQENRDLFHEKMSYVLQMVPPYDVVIVGDDEAFDFALKYQQELFPGIPIIFEGVSNVEKAEEASKSPLVSGVLESLSYENTIKMAMSLYPQATRVVSILDNTKTGISEREEFYKYSDKFPELAFSDINASELSQEELLRQVKSLGTETILIYVMCSEDGDGNIYANEEAVHMITSAAQIPTFSIVSIGMGKGFLGGEIVSQKQMGFTAGEMARQTLEGKDSQTLTLLEDSSRMFCFDENVMKRFEIKRSQLPADAEIVNHKENFFERYKGMAYIFILVTAVLLVFIALLIRDNKRKKNMNEAISESNERLKYISRYDALTSLLNRRVFMEETERRIALDQRFGLIMYDLDGFKDINDIYGHNEGDRVLRELAERSRGVSDEKMTVYRLAGDEFMAIVDDGDLKNVLAYAQAIQRTFETPYYIAGKQLRLCASMGIAMYPKDGVTKTELLASVDKAMYEVKNNGKNGIRCYRKGM